MPLLHIVQYKLLICLNTEHLYSNKNSLTTIWA